MKIEKGWPYVKQAKQAISEAMSQKNQEQLPLYPRLRLGA
jgi:hypothetical protein